jgi:hypothetical protein
VRSETLQYSSSVHVALELGTSLYSLITVYWPCNSRIHYGTQNHWDVTWGHSSPNRLRVSWQPANFCWRSTISTSRICSSEYNKRGINGSSLVKEDLNICLWEGQMSVTRVTGRLWSYMGINGNVYTSYALALDHDFHDVLDCIQGRIGFETRWGHWISLNLPNPSSRIMTLWPWGLLSL